VRCACVPLKETLCCVPFLGPHCFSPLLSSTGKHNTHSLSLSFSCAQWAPNLHIGPADRQTDRQREEDKEERAQRDARPQLAEGRVLCVGGSLDACWLARLAHLLAPLSCQCVAPSPFASWRVQVQPPLHLRARNSAG